MGKLGFKDIKVGYSGFSSQGDGASFTGEISSEDAIKFLKAHVGNKFKKITKEYPIVFKITRNGRYMHENSTSINWDYENNYVEQDFGVDLSNEYEDSLATVSDEINAWMYSKNKDIYKQLESAYDNESSEENIMSLIEANDYEFDENGKMV